MKLKSLLKKLTAKSQARRDGLTLIEILLVLALLTIVISMIGGRLFSSFNRGKVSATKIAIKQLEGDLDRFRLDCNRYPKTDEGLKALITKPQGLKCDNYDPNGYLSTGSKKTPTDAWGAEFGYVCNDGVHYVIKSLGADGMEGGDADNADISSEEK